MPRISTAIATAEANRARIELSNAIAAQKRHEKHRAKGEGRRCAWCDPSDRRVEEARAALAELERSA